MIVIPVILAGGVGERFWPVSTSMAPKQVQRLIGSRTMIEETVMRVGSFIDKTHPALILTGSSLVPKIKRCIPPRLPCTCIGEKAGKNTAPAIGLAASYIQNKYGDEAVMAVLTADHYITPKRTFVDNIKAAAHVAASTDALVVFGITPSRPDTGYGYVHRGKLREQRGAVRVFDVRRFVEKPDMSKAKRFFSSGTYYWNSGMFVWKTSSILDEYKRQMPRLYTQIRRVANKRFSSEAIDCFYLQADKESVDYGIMEGARKVTMVEATFEWDDVGSWESLLRHYPSDAAGTVVKGKKVFSHANNNSIVVNTTGRTVAAIGLDDMVMVVTDKVVLAVSREQLQELKKYIARMKDEGYPKSVF
jgi:mannose-1-phosphate guanylyltransferase